MLTNIKHWIAQQYKKSARRDPDGKEWLPVLEAATEDDIEPFINAAREADKAGLSPWSLRDAGQREAVLRSLAFVVHRQLWLQRREGQLEHWPGHMLVWRQRQQMYPVGMLLASHDGDESVWRLHFFFIQDVFRHRGYGSRMLKSARRELSGFPLQAILPVETESQVKCLESAGFRRRQLHSHGQVVLEAPAWALSDR